MARALQHKTPLELSSTKYVTLRESYPEKADYYGKIVVPALPSEAQRELRRATNPLATFRKWLRQLEIGAALEVVKARQVFVTKKQAVRWLPTHS